MHYTSLTLNVLLFSIFLENKSFFPGVTISCFDIAEMTETDRLKKKVISWQGRRLQVQLKDTAEPPRVSVRYSGGLDVWFGAWKVTRQSSIDPLVRTSQRHALVLASKSLKFLTVVTWDNRSFRLFIFFLYIFFFLSFWQELWVYCLFNCFWSG